MNKIEILENTPYNTFKEVIIRLLTSIDMSEIIDKGEYFTAIEKGALADTLNAFILPQFKLSGTVNVEKILRLIDNIQGETVINKVFFLSNYYISQGFKVALNQKYPGISINYLGRDDLILLFDKYQSDFWRHHDIQLLDYENGFSHCLENENQLKILKLPNDKYEKLMHIFIQPSLTSEHEDPKTHTYVRKRFDMGDLITEEKNCIVEGLSGTGKSTLLQNIGIELIKQNSNENLLAELI